MKGIQPESEKLGKTRTKDGKKRRNFNNGTRTGQAAFLKAGLQGSKPAHADTLAAGPAQENANKFVIPTQAGIQIEA